MTPQAIIPPEPSHGTYRSRPTPLKANQARMAAIQRIVARHYGLERSDLYLKTHVRRIAQPRWVVMFFLREWTTLTDDEIAEPFRLDRSIVTHGCRRVNELMAIQHSLKRDIEAIRALLKEKFGE